MFSSFHSYSKAEEGTEKYCWALLYLNALIHFLQMYFLHKQAIADTLGTPPHLQREMSTEFFGLSFYILDTILLSP